MAAVAAAVAAAQQAHRENVARVVSETATALEGTGSCEASRVRELLRNLYQSNAEAARAKQEVCEVKRLAAEAGARLEARVAQVEKAAFEQQQASLMRQGGGSGGAVVSQRRSSSRLQERVQLQHLQKLQLQLQPLPAALVDDGGVSGSKDICEGAAAAVKEGVDQGGGQFEEKQGGEVKEVAGSLLGVRLDSPGRMQQLRGRIRELRDLFEKNLDIVHLESELGDRAGSEPRGGLRASDSDALLFHGPALLLHRASHRTNQLQGLYTFLVATCVAEN
mmetsp:Transcript_37223/g.63370  ORF Transcript_37223/g.63370 Transcript_37223/m.63370 type:complete len:278 (-) Transcript_37223:21-854(-)